MKTLLLAASVLTLLPATAQAQLLGGGGLGGGLGGTIGGTLDTSTRGTIGGTLDRTTRTVRGTVDGTASTQGSQSVDARRGTVAADRSANGSLTGSTASLADLVVPTMGGMTSVSGSGSASGQGNANAQLIGTDALTGTLAPVAGGAGQVASNSAGQAVGTASGMIANTPMPSVPSVPAMGSASGEGGAAANGSASLTGPVLAVAGSSAAAGQGAASVAPGMPVMTPDGASLGKVRQVVANGRGQVQQVIVTQGQVTRTLPAGMFSASGSALIAGEATGTGGANTTAPVDSAADQ